MLKSCKENYENRHYTSGKMFTKKSFTYRNETFADSFHVYGIEWDEKFIKKQNGYQKTERVQEMNIQFLLIRVFTDIELSVGG